MKQVCLLCERTSPDNNLYCQEIYCPAEMSPTILDYGEWLGDIEIIKPMAVLRSATLYRARQQQRQILLYVAHPGQTHTDRLKRTAEFLRDIQTGKRQDDYLPVLLPAYANTTIKTDPYGKAMLRGHLLYFCVFDYFEGETLRDMLLKNPQLWIYHIGWLMIHLAYAVAFLQSKGKVHCGLSPETVLVHFDQKTNVPRILLFDLGIVSSYDDFSSHYDANLLFPAYTAPELLDQHHRTASYATDVYGLGLILYELLVGEPAFPFKLQSDADVYALVQQNRRVKMNRIEDVQRVADLALQSVNPQPAARLQSAADLAEQLIKQFGEVPGKKTNRQMQLKTSLVIIAALLAVAFLITLGVTITELFSFLS